jgi:hypothetical protein
MRTKFSLALALCHDADLILLDEPTAGRADRGGILRVPGPRASSRFRGGFVFSYHRLAYEEP